MNELFCIIIEELQEIQRFLNVNNIRSIKTLNWKCSLEQFENNELQPFGFEPTSYLIKIFIVDTIYTLHKIYNKVHTLNYEKK